MKEDNYKLENEIENLASWSAAESLTGKNGI